LLFGEKSVIAKTVRHIAVISFWIESSRLRILSCILLPMSTWIFMSSVIVLFMISYLLSRVMIE